MEAYRAIVTKRDTRTFATTPVPGEVLERLLQAGRMAGSARNAQPVRLVVLEDPNQKAELAACGEFANHVKEAPLAIAVVLLAEGGVPGAPFAIFRGPFDAGRAAQNIMIAAWSEGIASCPASMHHADRAATVLGLPEGAVVANVIALGYPAAAPPRERRPRLPREEYVHRERW